MGAKESALKRGKMEFKILDKDGRGAEEVLSKLDESQREEAEYIVEALLEMCRGEGCEAAIASYEGLLLIRIFDGGRYVFPFPVSLCDEVDEDMLKAALLRLADYTVRELIPFYMTDVDRENIDIVTELFPRVSASVYEDDENCFALQIENECPTEPISPLGLDLYLAEIRDEDKDEYLSLAFDKETSRLYGYDLKADMENIDAEGHLSLVRGERAAGVSLSLGVYKGETFVGDAVIFGFNYRGTAEVAVRIRSEMRGLGYGSRALALLIELAEKTGLKEVKTWVKNENAPSIKMVEKLMTPITEVGGHTLYYKVFGEN